MDQGLLAGAGRARPRLAESGSDRELASDADDDALLTDEELLAAAAAGGSDSEADSDLESGYHASGQDFSDERTEMSEISDDEVRRPPASHGHRRPGAASWPDQAWSLATTPRTELSEISNGKVRWLPASQGPPSAHSEPSACMAAPPMMHPC